MIDYPPVAKTRIAVLLGTGSFDRTLLDLADLLAAEMSAEVAGLFVEDIDLLELSSLPHIRELCRLTQTERALDTPQLERQLALQARAAQQALATTTDPVGVPWSFRAVRSTLDALLSQALGEMDMMLLDLTGTTPGIAPEARQIPMKLRRTLAVVFDGSAQAKRALECARRIAISRRRPVSVVLATTQDHDGAALREQAQAVLDKHPASFRELKAGTIGEILELARSERAHTLIMGIDSQWVNRENIELLRDRLKCPVLLVR